MSRKIEFLVLAVQEKSRNKTVRYFEKIGLTDYHVLVPKTVSADVAETYGSNLVYYDIEEPKKYVDFCGTNIENGAAVGRIAAQLWVREHKCIGAVWDDDYNDAGNRLCGYVSAYMLEGVLNDMYDVHLSTGLDLGGHSGGAFPSTHRNIMQIFLIDETTPLGKFRMILNEDVCASIDNWHHGIGTFGIATVIHSAGQTAEMKKTEGNTAMIYKADRSWRKSYGAVLIDPAHVKLVKNKVNDRGLWHHEVAWAKIMPKIIVEQAK